MNQKNVFVRNELVKWLLEMIRANMHFTWIYHVDLSKESV